MRLKELLERGGVDAGHGDERADAVYDERPDQEDEALAQLAEARCIAQHRRRIDCACLCHTYSMLPPAASMILRAPGVTLRPTTLTALSNLPEAMTFACSAVLAMICAAFND